VENDNNRPAHGRGDLVTFVATKVTKNAVSANGFFALADRTGGGTSLCAQSRHHHEAGIFLPGYPGTSLTGVQKSPMPPARALGQP